MHDIETPYPKASGSKEVYAFFGLAMYSAQVFEKGLLNLVVTCKMLDKFNASRQDFDNFFNEFDRKTLGKLLQIVKGHVEFDSSQEDQLDRALQRRNFLAHQYFWDNAEEMMSNAGRMDLMMELRNDIQLFNEADTAVESILDPLRQSLGVTDESLERAFLEIMANAEARDTAE